jgi:hypothetical protein
MLFWRVRATKFDQKRSSRQDAGLALPLRNELSEINELKEWMGKAPLTFGNPRAFTPLIKKTQYCMIPHIFCDVLALRYQYKRKWQTRSGNVVARTRTPLSRALTVHLVAALKVVTNQARGRGQIPRGGWRCGGFDWPSHLDLVCATSFPCRRVLFIHRCLSLPVAASTNESHLGRNDCATPQSSTDLWPPLS